MARAYACVSCGSLYPAPPPDVTLRCPDCGSEDRDELPDDLPSRFALLSEAFGMLEALAERHVEALSRRYLGEAADAADLHFRARRVLAEAREKANRALDRGDEDDKNG